MTPNSRIRCRFRRLTAASHPTTSTGAFVPGCSAWCATVRCVAIAGLLGLRLVPASRNSPGSVRSRSAFPLDVTSDVFRGNVPPFGTRLFSGTALGLSGALSPRSRKNRVAETPILAARRRSAFRTPLPKQVWVPAPESAPWPWEPGPSRGSARCALSRSGA